MFDKNKAKELRKQGLTYQEISEQLGCSISWCKANLNKTKSFKDLSNRELLEEMKKLVEEAVSRGVRDAS